MFRNKYAKKKYICNIESVRCDDPDYYRKKDVTITGWAFSLENKTPLFLEDVIVDGVAVPKTCIKSGIAREDVASQYRYEKISNCGFKVELNNYLPGKYKIEFNFNDIEQQSYVYRYTYKIKNKLCRIIISAIKKRSISVLKFKNLKKAALIFFNKYSYSQSCKNSQYKQLDTYLGYFDGKDKGKYNIDRTIDVIIPVYNGFVYLKSLVESVLKNTTDPYRIIFIDDCSTDPEVSRYLSEIVSSNTDFILLKNEVNLGFVKCVNKAYSVCKNDFIILNTDTEVPPYWMERLIKPLSCESIASVTPFSNAATICSFPLMMKDNPIYESLPVEVIDGYFQKIDDICFDVPTGVGFCMAVKKSVADQIGFFDEIFGRGYGEENDFCLRALKSGYRNVMIPNMFVYHKHGGSFTSQEKQSLMNANMNILISRYPNYLVEVSRFVDEDILQGIRIFIECLIQHNEKHRNTILVFDHDLGGGATLYCEEMISNLLVSNDIVILIKYKYSIGKYSLTIKGLDENSGEYLFDKIQSVEKIIGLLGVNKVYINELVTYPDSMDVLDVISKSKKAYKYEMVLLIHDYYCICPSINLLDFNNEYCCLPELSECSDCWNKKCRKSSNRTNINIEKWRAAWERILGNADKIVCFSESSKKILLTVYPDCNEEKISVIPHKVKEFDHKVRLIENNRSIINIAVIGNEALHKGSRLVFEMAKIAGDKKLPVRFYMMGSYNKKEESSFLKIVGPYNREDLPCLMEKYYIDLILIPSIWPETFSYTTEEAMMMDMPIAVFDLGAPPERIKKYAKGLIIEKIDAEYALSRIIRWIKMN
ncbi:MAG TPA: glycosyltransferase [Candidatus Dojkabacteria bacterium]|nr:glycosyltransferase [Candidatus Dojkabacteria bacterium]